MEDEVNRALLAVQKYREWVGAKREEVTHIWKNPPPPVMLAYGAVVMTSGMLLAALGQWSQLAGFIWGAELERILHLGFEGGELKVVDEGEGRIGDWIETINRVLKLPSEGGEEIKRLFLELVQWNLIESVNTKLTEEERMKLADVLRAGGSDEDRSRGINEFLKSVRVDSFAAREHLVAAVTRSVQETVGVFAARGYVEIGVEGGKLLE